MDIKKLIARKIKRKLGFTNGWSIDNEKYTELCNEVSEDIYKTISDHIGLKLQMVDDNCTLSEQEKKE